jgi:hypothetical protein
VTPSESRQRDLPRTGRTRRAVQSKSQDQSPAGPRTQTWVPRSGRRSLTFSKRTEWGKLADRVKVFWQLWGWTRAVRILLAAGYREGCWEEFCSLCWGLDHEAPPVLGNQRRMDCAEGGVGRRPARGADEPLNQSREAHHPVISRIWWMDHPLDAW